MIRIALFLIGLTALAAVACGDSSEPVDEVKSEETVAAATPTAETAPAEAAAQTAQTTQAAPASTPAAESSAPAAKVETSTETAPEEVVPGGVFRRLWADPPTLDPHLVTDTTSAGLVVELFSGLVALNTDLQLVPDIAERWDISEDGMVYTFYLRDNAKFHDGKPITAGDFKWSIERSANPDTASPVADTYLSDIVGLEAVLEGETTDISGIKVVDEHTLQIQIDAPKAYFLAKLTYPTAYVLDKENVEAAAATGRTRPTGQGRSSSRNIASARGSYWSATRTTTASRRTWNRSR